MKTDNFFRIPFLVIVFLSAVILFSSCQKQPDEIKVDTVNNKDAAKIQFKKQGEVYFQDSAKKLLKKIDVEIAETEETRHLGLMYRENMQEDQGMLFLFPAEEYQSFYMKNTVMPLDIMFINSKKQIVKIHRNTVPYSEKSLPSMNPSIYVVEVNAGFADKYNIKEGSHIDWRRY
ncbi:MAG TPA: DUF192 domain-containing protein [Ignavibacteria bacterium]|nr:DUF192 domain-containing protein [Ignavibacteria bacterium]HMQ98200.1 DUF192 domain-containing protein [Ignavibacteria bacterium]